MPRILFVVAPQTFRDEEYAHPKQVLDDLGAETVTASTRPGICTGKLGMTAHAEVALSDVGGADYDAVVFVGGGGAQVYFDDPEAHRVSREALEAGRVVAAICIAPSVLAHAGLLGGIRVTSFPSQKDDLIAHGAEYTGEPLERDGRFITANGPDAARDFGHAIATALGLEGAAGVGD